MITPVNVALRVNGRSTSSGDGKIVGSLIIVSAVMILSEDESADLYITF